MISNKQAKTVFVIEVAKEQLLPTESRLAFPNDFVCSIGIHRDSGFGFVALSTDLPTIPSREKLPLIYHKYMTLLTQDVEVTQKEISESLFEDGDFGKYVGDENMVALSTQLYPNLSIYYNKETLSNVSLAVSFKIEKDRVVEEEHYIGVHTDYFRHLFKDMKRNQI